MVLGEGHIPEHRARLHHLHRFILEGVAPGSIHPDLWREGRRAEVSSDPALLAVELQPRDPPTARAEAVSSVSAVPRGQAQKGRSDTAHHGLMLGMAKRGTGGPHVLHQEPEFFSLVPCGSGKFWRRGWCWQWGAGLGLGNSG